MPRMTTADAAVAILRREGVTNVFGLPGAAINPFYAAMRRDGGITHTLARHVEGASMLARNFAPGFRIALHDKDMGIVTAAAREAGVVIPLGAVAAQLVASLKAQGDGGLDHSALLKLVSQLSGRQ